MPAHGVPGRPLPRARTGTRVAFCRTPPEARSPHSLWPTLVCAGTHAWWPWPGLLTQDSAVPGGLAAGAGDTLASRAAVLTVRREVASSLGRALTREVCSGSVAAHVHRPKLRGVRTREGLRSFGTVPMCGATHLRPEGTGASALKAWRNSASTLAERHCQPRLRAAEPPPTRPCRAPLSLPRPRPPQQSPTPAHAALCTCPPASALSRRCSFVCWRPP